MDGGRRRPRAGRPGHAARRRRRPAPARPPLRPGPRGPAPAAADGGLDGGRRGGRGRRRCGGLRPARPRRDAADAAGDRPRRRDDHHDVAPTTDPLDTPGLLPLAAEWQQALDLPAGVGHGATPSPRAAASSAARSSGTSTGRSPCAWRAPRRRRRQPLDRRGLRSTGPSPTCARPSPTCVLGPDFAVKAATSIGQLVRLLLHRPGRRLRLVRRRPGPTTTPCCSRSSTRTRRATAFTEDAGRGAGRDGATRGSTATARPRPPRPAGPAAEGLTRTCR